MEKYIHITKEDREFIAKVFNCTQRSVFNAITFDKERGFTEQARKIRKVAMERGGIVMNVIPEVETLHDSDGYMRQYMPNGALLEFNKKDGTGAVIFKGETKKTYDKVLVSNIEGIQNYAAALR